MSSFFDTTHKIWRGGDNTAKSVSSSTAIPNNLNFYPINSKYDIIKVNTARDISGYQQEVGGGKKRKIVNKKRKECEEREHYWRIEREDKPNKRYS
jgi:hypothetical protein